MARPVKIEVDDDLWYRLEEEGELEGRVVAQFPEEDEPRAEWTAKLTPSVAKGFAWLEVELEEQTDE